MPAFFCIQIILLFEHDIGFISLLSFIKGNFTKNLLSVIELYFCYFPIYYKLLSFKITDIFNISIIILTWLKIKKVKVIIVKPMNPLLNKYIYFL